MRVGSLLHLVVFAGSPRQYFELYSYSVVEFPEGDETTPVDARMLVCGQGGCWVVVAQSLAHTSLNLYVQLCVSTCPCRWVLATADLLRAVMGGVAPFMAGWFGRLRAAAHTPPLLLGALVMVGIVSSISVIGGFA